MKVPLKVPLSGIITLFARSAQLDENSCFTKAMLILKMTETK
jgi:hypothetical protein